MKTVYKYTILAKDDPTTVEMPLGAEILRLEMSPSLPVLEINMWALVQPNNVVQDRTFQTTGTGHPVPEQARYVGTVTPYPLVWHLWEVS